MKWLEKSTEGDYSEFINQIFPNDCLNVEITEDFLNSHAKCRNITLQVTDECNCACTYCYQGNKCHNYMTFDTGKKIVDLLFNMWYANVDEGFINQTDTKAIILDFIGGEPLLNVEVIDQICDYFWTRCILENHPWRNTWMASFSSNGSLYFSNDFQNFLKKYNMHVSYSITVDGPEEIHDACRVYKDGSGGNFKDAYAALMHYRNNINSYPGTKVTIASENLDLLNTIIDFFLNNKIIAINANVIYEHKWTAEEGARFYQQLKTISDKALNFDGNIFISLFNETFFSPLDTDDISNNRNWCGGTGAMLAFDPNGIAYPCLRYMPSSLGKDIKPIIIGDTTGIYNTEETENIKIFLDSITRRSQSTDECFNCPIAAGCSWCSAWNYQETGTPNCRSTRICNAHKARALANVYFWNKYYLQENIPKTFHRYLSDDESLKFISKSELDLLDDLEKQTQDKIDSLKAME